MSRQPSKTANIREIARRAGVSIASVSRALNGKPGISEALRERILTISRDVEYRPSAAARQLISGKAAVVGISLGRRDFELRPYYILLYQHLTVALHRQGMVPIFFAHDRTSTLPEQAGAAILLGEFADDPRPELMRSRSVPFVRIGLAGEGFSVAPEDRHGIYLATRHLIEKGRRRIAFVGDELTSPHSQHRLGGYRQALDEAGFEAELIDIPPNLDPALTGYRWLSRRLEREPRAYDGLVCETDELARGCLTALEDHGLSVPGEVAVTGFDDLPTLAEGLTTVRQDIAGIAAMSVELLGEAQASKTPRHVSMPVELVVRETS
ncbi:LacI family DNA-binding transcriptional regulator [Halomonas elongata]|uniref:HTH-type transcriptional regulator GalR n=1 Tax=Halomonas elongata TaxID=2746 RepID=A0A1B8NUR7_HALEL|nr:LacI family DNA-binding transcriptional regulator [Halomonas elongata]MBW5799903.1 LacI family transcriptional regulator [Halomonas elongata]OBX33754.1 HTH-type transcriptional regulator GalR [Halomonas elongata]